MPEEIKFYTLLIIDRHCDPMVIVFRNQKKAEEEAFKRAREYWGVFEAQRAIPIDTKAAILRISCGDVGEMIVRQQRFSDA